MKKTTLSRSQTPSRTSGMISRAYPFFMTMLFPLLMGPGLYLTIAEAKFSFFMAATLTALLVFTVFRSKLPPGPKPGTVGTFLLLYAVWAFISAFFSIYSWEGILTGQSRCDGLILLYLYLIAFFVSFRSEAKTESIGKWMAIASFPMSLIAIIQEYGSPFLFPTGYTYRGVQFLSTIGHHDCYAGIASMMIPFFCCCFVLSEQPQKKKARELLYPTASLLLMYSFLETEVDSGRVALLCAFLVMLPFLIDTAEHLCRLLTISCPLLLAVALKSCIDITRKYVVSFTPTALSAVLLFMAVLCPAAAWLLKRKKIIFRQDPAKFRRIAYLTITVLGASGLGAAFFYRGDRLLLIELSELLHGRLDDHAGQLRGYIWKASCDIIARHPLLGTGPGTFPAAFEPYNAGYMELTPNTAVDMAHNDYLQIAACLGIPGLLLYLGFLGSFLWKTGKALLSRKCSSVTVQSLLPVLSAVTAYLIYCLFLSSSVIVSPLFWVLCGTGLRMCYFCDSVPLPN